MSNELVTIETLGSLVPADVFKAGGIQPILDAITKEISTEVPDVSTDKGRKAIAGNAAKISRSKTLLDGMGKSLADELNAKLKPINAERKLARDTLDELRDKTREPLTKFEEEEKQRVIEAAEKHAAEKMAEQIENDHEMGLLLNEKFDRDLAEAKAAEEKQRLETEEADRKARAIESERIAKEAAEAERVKVEQEIEAAKQEAIDAENRLKEQAEAAEKQRIEAAEKAEQEKQAAIDAEQRRQHDQKVREQQEIEKREANLKHCKKINNEALACFEKGGLSTADAKTAVELIAKKMIANVSISY